MKWSDVSTSGACGITGILNESGTRFSGKAVVVATTTMQPRYNGLGGGYSGYGIYPEYKDYYAFHVMHYDEESKRVTEEFLNSKAKVVKDEPIPTRHVGSISNSPLLWRYFVEVPENSSLQHVPWNQDDYVISLVMHINSETKGSFVMSSGKNMGVFKAVGFPHDVATFYRIDEYAGYMWLGHGRYPTNTPGWWGGAHPFNILGTSVIHNGEISSYGTNKRYLEQWKYKCMLQTDTEVLAYLIDLLHRKHGIPLAQTCTIMAAPFWSDIEQMSPEKRELLRAMRMVYPDALVNGPFSIVVGMNYNSPTMFGLTDRIKLRPLMAARKDDTVYVASEECAIRSVCPNPDSVWAPKAGVPVVAKVMEV